MIPPKHIANQLKKKSEVKGISLESGHLVVSSELMARLGEKVETVFAAYVADKQHLLITDVRNAFFPKLHEATQHMVKLRNARGDASIAIQELIIDQDIPRDQQELAYEFLSQHSILKIQLRP